MTFNISSCAPESLRFQLFRLYMHFTLFQIACIFKELFYFSISQVDQFALCSDSLGTLSNSNGSPCIPMFLLLFLTSQSKDYISPVLFLKDLIMLISRTQKLVQHFFFCPQCWILETEEFFQLISKMIVTTKLDLSAVTLKIVQLLI